MVSGDGLVVHRRAVAVSPVNQAFSPTLALRLPLVRVVTPYCLCDRSSKLIGSDCDHAHENFNRRHRSIEESIANTFAKNYEYLYSSRNKERKDEMGQRRKTCE